MHPCSRTVMVVAVCAIALLVLGTEAAAQVVVKLQQPPPNQLALADLWQAAITNPTSAPIEVYLVGTITGGDGALLEAKSDHFTVRRGVTYVTTAQLGAVSIVRSAASLEPLVRQTGSLRGGTYSVCLGVRDARTDAVIGRDCIEQRIAPSSGDEAPERPEPRVDPCLFGNWGFESGTLCRWHAEGDAFASGQPVRASPATLADGAWYLGTSDAATGTLSSDTFEITTGYVRFLIGGGGDGRHVGVELHLLAPGDTGDAVVYRVRGTDVERMAAAELDVRRFARRRAFLRIVDDGSGLMEHISVDRFVFTNEPLVQRIVAAECDLVNWDFETSTLHCWLPSAPAPEEDQNAFSWQPVRYAGPRGAGAPSGAYWINTRLVQAPPGGGAVGGAQWKGSLTSKLVTLDRRWITFQLGGGFPDGAAEPGELRVELLVADETSATGYRAARAAIVTGDDRPRGDELRRVAWSVADLVGSSALVRIVDSSSVGYIACDDFELTDAEPVNWDFEEGLDYWRAIGSAFREQPTLGAVIPATRARPPGFDAAQTAALGGDYWNTIANVGQHLDRWIGTAERHPTADSPLLPEPQDTCTGVLISREFRLSSRYVTLLVGGSRSERVRAELFVDSAAAARRSRSAATSAAGATSPAVAMAGRFIPAGFAAIETATPTGSEMMRRIAWDVGDLPGARAYVVITDDARDAHINVDDILFANERRLREYPAGGAGETIARDTIRDDPPELWGFGDFSTHPMTHLGTGGLLHGEPLGPVARALRPCDGLTHGARQSMPVSRSIAEVRTIARLLLPFASLERALPSEPGGSIDLPRIILQVMSRTRGGDGHLQQGMSDFSAKIRFTGREGREVERGWPSFTTVAHQQMHRDWIRRAWQGGLRIMCAVGFNNELLSVAAGRRQRDADVLAPQMELVRQMARENAEWMEIAYSAADARRIVGSGKLAVVLGVEYDRLEELFPETGTIAEKIDTALDRLTRLGVRQIVPIHFADNIFGGQALGEDLHELNGYYLGGRFSGLRDGASQGVTYRAFGGLAGLDRASLLAALGAVAADEPVKAFMQTTFGLDATRLVADLQRATDSAARYTSTVNALGLTDAGRALLGAMMRRGLLIGIDNMSGLAADSALGILERNDYPLLAAHNDARGIHATERTERQRTDEQMRAIARLGGVAGATASLGDDVTGAESAPGSSLAWLKAYEYAMARMPGAGIGIATDMGAFHAGLGPRFGPQALPPAASTGGRAVSGRGVLYRHYGRVASSSPGESVAMSIALAAAPGASRTRVAVDKAQPPMTACRTGSRTFDFNTDGLAHIGLVPDMLQDCRNLGMGAPALRVLMGSAEAFVRMWEKAEQRAQQLRTGRGGRR